MQRNFTGSKISTLNENKYTKSSPQFVFSRPIDRKIKMTAQPLICRDIFVHLRRRHKHPLMGYISVRQILTFHIYEFSETACTQNPLTALYFSSQSLSACVSIWSQKASTQNPIPSLYFRANHYRHVVQSKIIGTREHGCCYLGLFSSLWRPNNNIPYGCWLVGCCLTSHSAIFQLYSDGTIVQFSKFIPAARHPTPWAVRGL